MIENILNGKFYIGKTVKTVQERFKQHIQRAKKRINCKLYDAMNHYGIDKFVVHVIEDNIQSEDILNEREIYWIAKLNAIENGYNMAAGGNGGGRPDMAQAGGKQPEQVDAALQAGKDMVKNLLG